MSDIVERLRHGLRRLSLQGSTALMDEAADEIERLRVVGSWDNKLNAMMAELKAIHERIKRLGI